MFAPVYCRHIIGIMALPTAEKKKDRVKSIWLPLLIFVNLMLFLVYVADEKTIVGSYVRSVVWKPVPIIVPTSSPDMSPTIVPTNKATTIPAKTSNKISCQINDKCGGGTKLMTSAECNNTTCCLYDQKCGGAKLTTSAECSSNVCCGLIDGTAKVMTKAACDSYQASIKGNNEVKHDWVFEGIKSSPWPTSSPYPTTAFPTYCSISQHEIPPSCSNIGTTDPQYAVCEEANRNKYFYTCPSGKSPSLQYPYQSGTCECK